MSSGLRLLIKSQCVTGVSLKRTALIRFLASSKAHPLPCSSSSLRTRFAGLCKESQITQKDRNTHRHNIPVPMNITVSRFSIKLCGKGLANGRNKAMLAC